MLSYTVIGKFEEHFVKQRNIIFERAKFNNRRQEQDEPVDTFITALYTLAENCDYGALHDEMIPDRIVVGIRNTSLSEKLQLDAELTLTTALAKVRQAEVVKKQQTLLRGETPATTGKHDTPVGAVERGRRSNRQAWKPKSATTAQPSRISQSKRSKSKDPLQSQGTCTRCGRSPTRDRRACPAREAVCHKCSKCGHFASVCRTPARVREIHEDTNTFLGGVSTPETDNNPWRMSIRLNNTPTEFDIDTGAEVSVISKTRHDEIGHPPLASPDRVLRGPSNRCLPVIGQFKGVLKRGNHEVQQEIFVVQNLSRNLLGRPAIEALKLAVRVGAIFDNTSPIQLFPKMFQGLGKLEGEYVIELKDNHKPFAISVP